MMIRKSGDWLSARAGDEVMMMSAARGTYLGLNAMGARIWDLIDSCPDRDALCAQLLTEFEVSPEQCRYELDKFLAELGRQQAIEWVPAGTI